MPWRQRSATARRGGGTWRDLAIAVITDRAQDPTLTVDGDFLTRLNRVLYQ